MWPDDAKDERLSSALVSHTGIDTFGDLPNSKHLLRSYFLGLYPITFPSMCCDPNTALSWPCFTELKCLLLSQNF